MTRTTDTREYRPLVVRPWHRPLLWAMAGTSAVIGLFEQTQPGPSAWLGRALLAGTIVLLALAKASNAAAARWRRAARVRRIFDETKRNAPLQ